MELHHSRANAKSLPSPIRRVLVVLLAMVALLLITTVISGSIFEPPSVGGPVGGGRGGDAFHKLNTENVEVKDVGNDNGNDDDGKKQALLKSKVTRLNNDESHSNQGLHDSKSIATSKKLAVPPSSPLHIGAFLDDPSLAVRCSNQSATLEELRECPSLAYTDALFEAIRSIADNGGNNDGSSVDQLPKEDSSSRLQMSMSPLDKVPPLRYAVTNGRTTADMNLFFTKDDDSNRGGNDQVPLPPKGSVHPSFEVYKRRTMRGALVGTLSHINKLVPMQKKVSEMLDNRNAKAGVLDGEWVGGHTLSAGGSSSALSVPAISHKTLENTRVFEFNGVHTKYHFDCVPDIDFRQYHQVRAASCIDHERLYARAVEVARKGGDSLATFVDKLKADQQLSLDDHDESGTQLGAYLRVSASGNNKVGNSERDEKALSARLIPNYVGLYPIVDEEYFEYSFTLAVAHDAAVNGRRFTFIELGARYGTWLVRAAAAYRLFYKSNEEQSSFRSATTQLSIPVDKLRLLAVEGNCYWFRRMEEHVRCNGLEPYSTLLLAYAAPISYNKVNPKSPDTYKLPRAVSIVQMVNHYVELDKAHKQQQKSGGDDEGASTSHSKEPAIDMIDFDIQGFETISIEHEEGAVEALTAHVGFIHFGTHGTEIEASLLRILQPKGWCVVYFYAGAHTKNLQKGHRCNTPYGSSVFNDGAMGLANMKYYKEAFRPPGGGEPTCPSILNSKSKKVVKSTCYFAPQALTMIKRG